MKAIIRSTGLLAAGILLALFTVHGQALYQSFEVNPVSDRFVHLPVKKGASKTWMTVNVDGVLQHEFEIELAPEKPDFYATLETGHWAGKKLTLTAESIAQGSDWLNFIKMSDQMSDEETVYTEKYRPQFHFSPRRGWTNDPNGLHYYKGIYHLFYQHNPYGTGWGNMTWGHAISTDLFHWNEKPDAVLPDKNGVSFSGSAAVDWKNSSGLQEDPLFDENGKLTYPPQVAFYTSTNANRGIGPAAQSLAYSLDEGRTWIKYRGNPVIPHITGGNRDPKVFWYEDEHDQSNPYSGRWIMVLYMDGQDFALFSSCNLIRWEKLSDIKNAGYECPDMFELPVDGDINDTRWIFWEAGGKYLIGSFNGKEFLKESGPHLAKYGGNDYAAQTFSDIPATDGRRIMLSWMSGGEYPGMPFNQQFSIPRNLTLRSTDNGIRLFMEPVKEIEKLRISKPIKFSKKLKGEDRSARLKLDGELFDLELTFTLAPDAMLDTMNVIRTEIFRQNIMYNPGTRTIELEGVKAPLIPVNNQVKLRLIIDRTSIELFANDGIVQISKCFINEDKAPANMTISGRPGLARFTVNAFNLKSVWRNHTERSEFQD